MSQNHLGHVDETELEELMKKVASNLMELPPEKWLDMECKPIQQLLNSMIKIYAFRIEHASSTGKNEEPVLLDEYQISATDVAILADRLLRAVKMELFELQMWRGMSINS